MSYSLEYEGKVVESENSSPVLVTPELEVQVHCRTRRVRKTIHLEIRLAILICTIGQ